jgi:hypothetical protein
VYVSMGFGPFRCGVSDSILAGLCGFCGRHIGTGTVISPDYFGFPLSLTFYRRCMLIRMSPTLYRGADKSLDRPTSLSVFFQSREQVIVRRGQIRRIGWVIMTLEAQVGQFLLGRKCPVRRFLPGRAKDLSTPLYSSWQHR